MAKPAPAATYQYHVEEVSDVIGAAHLAARLNALGADGWYMIAAEERNPATQRRQLLFVRYTPEEKA